MTAATVARWTGVASESAAMVSGRPDENPRRDKSFGRADPRRHAQILWHARSRRKLQSAREKRIRPRVNVAAWAGDIAPGSEPGTPSPAGRPSPGKVRARFRPGRASRRFWSRSWARALL